MSALDFNIITNKEIDSYNRLLEHEQDIKRLQSDKIVGEDKDNREKRREFVKSSEDFKSYKKVIFDLVDKYDKVLSSGALENIVDINKEIEDRLNNIINISEATQKKIRSLIEIIK